MQVGSGWPGKMWWVGVLFVKIPWEAQGSKHRSWGPQSWLAALGKDLAPCGPGPPSVR